MNRYLLFVLILLLINTSVVGQRTCGSVYNQEYINSLPSNVKEKLKKFNDQLQENNNEDKLQDTFSATTSINPNDVILIPVVVHVVWNTASQNISDDQICSQIVVLNEDFGRNNPDAANTPGSSQQTVSQERIPQLRHLHRIIM